MKMHIASHAVLPFVLVSAASAQSSQGGDSTDFALNGSTFWPSTLATPGVVTRMVVGEVTGDRSLDAVVLAGTQPALLYSVATHTTVLGLPAPANDLDIAARAAPGGWDAIAVVRDTGLVLVTCAAGGSFTSSANIATAEWLGATKVRCADLDASGSADFVGLGASPTRILVHRSGGTPQDVAFDCPEAVIDLAPLRWEANVYRIAALTTAGVRIFDLDGNPVEPLVAYAQADAFTVLDGAARDRIGLLYHDAAASYLTVLKRGAPSDAPQIVPAVGAFGLSSADVNFDRADEVIIAHRAHHGALYLENVFPALPNLDVPGNTVLNGPIEVPDSSIVLQTTLRGFAASTALTQPLFADLDGDGIGDALLSVRSLHSSGGGISQQFTAVTFIPPLPPPPPPPQGGGPHIYPQETIEKLGDEPLPPGEIVDSIGSTIVLVEDEDPGDQVDDSHTLVEAHVRLDFRTSAWPGNANAVEMIVWRQSVLGAVLDHHALSNPVYVLDPGVVPGSFIGLDMDLQFEDTSLAPGTPNPGCFSQIYWVEIRPVVWTGSAVGQAFRTRVCAIGHGNSDGPVHGKVLWGDPDQIPANEAGVVSCGPSGVIGSSTVITGVRRRRIPNFAPEVVPVLPVPSPSSAITPIPS